MKAMLKYGTLAVLVGGEGLFKDRLSHRRVGRDPKRVLDPSNELAPAPLGRGTGPGGPTWHAGCHVLGRRRLEKPDETFGCIRIVYVG